MTTDALVPMDAVEATYKALADRTRLRILSLLMEGEVCVCDIHDTLRVPQPTASRHLSYLRRAGLVEARREGTWMYYRLADLDPVIRAIVQTAGHAMSHVAGMERDRRRFEKQSGKSLPVIQPARAPCCSK
jgi:ArsR family transcriptional regulator